MRKILVAKATLLLALAGASQGRGDELSRTDKLRVLYSNQFAFDRRGIPLITIAIAEGIDSAIIEGTAAVRVLPDGEDGSEVRAGKRWKITLRRARKAVLEHFAILTRRPTTQLKQIQQLRAAWSKKKPSLELRIIEIGTIFGVKGQVFDNRAFLLVDGPWKSAAEAQRRADRLGKELGLDKTSVVSQLKRRPSGDLELTSLETSTRIRVKDAAWFAPDTPKSRLSVRRHSSAESHAYWGQVYVTLDSRGRLAVVNAVPADKLLAGLVPAETFPTAPRAALGAQAVAARGDLLAKIGTRHLTDPYLICSWQHCQVYRGAGSEHPAATAAISRTRGQVLVRKGGGLVKALYSAHCGGHTEDNDQVWPVPADTSLRGRLDAPSSNAFAGKAINDNTIRQWLAHSPSSWCARSGVNRNKLRWRTRLSRQRVSELVRSLSVGPVTEIKVLARGRSGRANRIRLRGALGSREVRGELTIRRLFGGLRSSMFIVKPIHQGDALTAFEFIGGGWGHGVGMCQTGAIGMAKAGHSYQQILSHYYSASKLRRVY